jgi:outer membrane lipoprotein-sorting protein
MYFYRRDGNLKRAFQLLSLLLLSVLLVACGEKSQEDIVSEVNKAWADSNYELTATMEVKGGDNPRLYDVLVWHTKPEFYRVEIREKDSEASQYIIKNEEGVFLVTPSNQKTYKFQTDWPKKNSQSYLIGALAEDLVADKAAAMEQTEKHYIFEAATRNQDKTGLPSQQITVDKKTLLPSKVSLLDESMSEQIVISFHNINLKAKHKPEEYVVTMSDSQSTEAVPFKVHYPSLAFDNTQLIDEVIIKDKGNERAVLSYEGDKSFTLIQYPVKTSDKLVSVSVPGDPEWLGTTYGAIHDNTLTWDQNGISFLLTSDELTSFEMVQLAASLSSESMK